MSGDMARFTKEEFEEALKAILKTLVVPPAVGPRDNPRAFLLGGQSGTGKTKLHSLLNAELEGGAIVINDDEYRSRHPRYRELDAAYGAEAVAHTASWAGKMTESLIDMLSSMRYNFIIESTLRTAEVPLKTATLLRERGYGVSLALMAVKPEISLISCQIRYELMRIAGTIPRATDSQHHNKIIQEIVANLAVLEQSGLFDEVRLFSQAGVCLYPHDGERQTASQVLQDVLFGPWTSEEQDHYAYLQEQLSRLKEGTA